jgi:uncharacterized protein YcbX
VRGVFCGADAQELEAPAAREGAGSQFSCFIGTKVQILSQKALQGLAKSEKKRDFTCFTGTKVQILTQRALQGLLAKSEKKRESKIKYVHPNIHHPYFACFTGKHVQILTQKALLGTCAATSNHASRTCRALPLVQSTNTDAAAGT